MQSLQPTARRSSQGPTVESRWGSPKLSQQDLLCRSVATDLCGTLLQASSTTSRSLPSPAPPVGGVRISTCSFQLTETFQTSADELYRTFLEQEVPEPRTPPPPPSLPLLLPHLGLLVSSTSYSPLSSSPPPSFSSSCSSISSCFYLSIALPVTPPPPVTPLTLPPPHSIGFFFLLLRCHCAKDVVPSLSLVCAGIHSLSGSGGRTAWWPFPAAGRQRQWRVYAPGKGHIEVGLAHLEMGAVARLILLTLVCCRLPTTAST